jgi:nucleoside-diphosphate-sugar epimerase
MQTVVGSGIWNCGSGLSHSFLDIAEYIAEQEEVEIRTIPVPDSEKTRWRQNTCANLKHLKETVAKRQWLNLYEWLDLET